MGISFDSKESAERGIGMDTWNYNGIPSRTFFQRLIDRRRTIAEAIQEKQRIVHQRWLKEECEQMEKERDCFITRCLDNIDLTDDATRGTK